MAARYGSCAPSACSSSSCLALSSAVRVSCRSDPCARAITTAGSSSCRLRTRAQAGQTPRVASTWLRCLSSWYQEAASHARSPARIMRPPRVCCAPSASTARWNEGAPPDSGQEALAIVCAAGGSADYLARASLRRPLSDTEPELCFRTTTGICAEMLTGRTVEASAGMTDVRERAARGSLAGARIQPGYCS